MLTADTTADRACELIEAVSDAMAPARTACPAAEMDANLTSSLLECLQLIGDPGAHEQASVEQRLVRWLTPHLRLIQKQPARAAKQPLDHAPLAMALCDITGHLRWANRPMDALLLGLPTSTLQQMVDLKTSRPTCHALRIGDRTHSLIALNAPALGPTNVVLLAKPGNVKQVYPAVPRPRLNDQTLVIDGHRLGYAEYGPADGTPVLFMHNWSGSRLQVPLDTSCLYAQGVRLIAPDQPGHGLTSLLPVQKGTDGHTQWAGWIEQFADALALDQFAIMGYCTGTIHALACAKFMPRRITRVVLISPFAPIRHLADMASLQGSGKLMHGHWGKLPEHKLPLIHLWQAQIRQQPGQCRDHFLIDLALREHAATASPAQQAQYARSFVEAIYQSDETPLRALRLIASDWSNLLDTRQPVTIWHGGEDRTVPPSHCQRLAHTLPNAKLRHVPGSGHDLGDQHWPEIIRTLKENLSQVRKPIR